MGYVFAFVREITVTPYGSKESGSSGESPPASPTDVIDTLGAEIATLAAHIHSATHWFLVLIASTCAWRGR